MATHDFGIMPIAPRRGERFDDYRLEAFDTIAVNDNDIEPLMEKLSKIKMYAHTIDNPYPGLAYYGITLIPPEAMGSFIETVDGVKELLPLKMLLIRAKENNKYIIHFGL